MAVRSRRIDLLLLMVILAVLGLQVAAILIATSLVRQPTSEAPAEATVPDTASQALQEPAPSVLAPIDRAAAPTHVEPSAETEPTVVPQAPDLAAPPLIDATPLSAETDPAAQFEASPAEVSESPQPDAEPTLAEQQTDSAQQRVEPAAGEDPGLRGPDWLQQRDPNRYTIQIQSGADLSGIRRFVHHNELPESQAYYRTFLNGRPWYGLVAGDYPDWQTASAAAAEFTTRYPGIKLWIRRFGTIQAQMR